ncbi:ABC transporter permease [Cryobacterium glaciale]|uniref:ABC transporter permease n=1 Tax=Cryobacterium glaciale TaxID=1259145 RepID=UPI00141A7068|nr:ABC transporter permease [Cryobacterium glaciale]
MRERLVTAGFFVGLLLVWEVLSDVGVLNPSLAPGPRQVLGTGVMLFEEGLLYDMRVTLTYILASFAIAVVGGVLIGALLSVSATVTQVAEGFLTFLLSIPKSLFLPLFILIVGIGAAQKIAFGVFSSFAVIVAATIVGLAQVDHDLVRMARSQGATPLQIFFKTHLPSMTPTLLEAARIAMILNITGVLIAEMYASREGLGYLVSNYGQNFQVDRLLVVIFVVTTIGIVLNEILRGLELRQERWREGT